MLDKYFIIYILFPVNSLAFLPALIIFLGVVSLVTLQNKNYLLYVLCLEIMLAGVNLGFLFITLLNSDPNALSYMVLILGIAAAEVALGIAIIILIYNLRGTTQIT